MAGHGADDIVGRAAAVAERAVTYAESVIEGLELVMLTGNAVVTDPRSIEECQTADMEAVTRAIARAFALGYAAALGDGRPVRALGGASEPRARKGKRRG